MLTVFEKNTAEVMFHGLNAVDAEERQPANALFSLILIYGRSTLEVLLNTPRMAFVIVGLAKKTASATSTINKTYSTMVCPDSGLSRFSNRVLK
jgi:hypothetical protein